MILGKNEPSKNLLNCTNIIHHRQLVKKILDYGSSVVEVLKVFRYNSDGKNKTMEIDLVVDLGSTWIKVKATNPEALLMVMEGNGYYGQKTILETCKALLECASQNLFEYKPPAVAIDFSTGVPPEVVTELKELGVLVLGNALEKYGLDLPQVAPESEKINSVNLDVTSLIFLSSDVTNGGAYKKFSDDMITMAAEQEREEPSLAAFLEFIEGKDLIMTQTALRCFEPIVNIVAGETEKIRAKEWLSKIRIVEDDPSERSLKLKIGKAKDQHRIIFGTGDKMKVITTTGNISFVRSARQQGLDFSVHVHPSRPFTEQKIIE